MRRGERQSVPLSTTVYMPPVKRNKQRRDLWPVYKSGEEAIEAIRSMTDTIILSFSRGKDSVGAWLALREWKPAFKRIIPIYYWMVPDLEFEEVSLKYYEKWFGEHIVRVPSAAFWNKIRHFKYQPPQNIPVIDAAMEEIPAFTSDDLYEWVWQDMGYKGIPWTAIGVRAVDSPMRWSAMKKYGPVNFVRQVFYPVFDWNSDRLYDKLIEADIKLPQDYRIWGRSMDGTDRRFLQGLKEHYPADFNKVLDYFPLADAGLWRAEYGFREQKRLAGLAAGDK